MWFFSPPEAFKINKDSGLVVSRRRLQSYERFNLTVVATDKGRPPLWGTTMLHIEVIDINDNRPVFIRPPNGTILHIKEVNPLRGSRGHGMPRPCLGAFLPTGGKTETPEGLEQDLDSTCSKKVWVMGLDGQQQHLSVHGSGHAGAALGNRNPGSTQNKETDGHCVPSLWDEMLTFKMFLLSGKPGLSQPVPSACMEQPPC